MRSKSKFTRVTSKAFTDLAEFERSPFGGRAGDFAVARKRRAGSKARWTQIYAQNVANVNVVLGDLREKGGFASWLLRDPASGCALIALDDDRVGEFARQRCPQHDPLTQCSAKDAVRARVILHEVGHLRVTPGVLARMTHEGFAFSCRSDSESAAWAYAFSLLALFASRYAKFARGEGHDDTAALCL